jgi:DNA-binding NarL/FixJ family response regulator
MAARCLLRWVHEARRLAGRDEKWGRRHHRPAGQSRSERQRDVRRLDEQGLNAKQIARALGIPYSTVLRDLRRKA